jgi:hypothetical protein
MQWFISIQNCSYFVLKMELTLVRTYKANSNNVMHRRLVG